MRCPSCHHDNRSDRRFCTQCGTKLATGCPSCGAPIEVGEKFCGGCGAALTIGGRTTTPSPAHAPLLVEKIRQAKATVEGERKQVTVLFADVKGSMELAEQLDPEAWSQIMQRFFRILCDDIERFEGFVDKFTGDGGMAIFGAPIAHQDHAQRACYAALHLRDAARTYASEVRAQHGVPFAVRIGLNSGEVVVGRIGDDLRMEFTAQGHVVGLAQRMEAIAESGHICLSEHTARLVEGYFQLHDLGRITVKGVSEPVGLFDLEAVGSFRTRFDRSRARGLSEFVGRDREMAALDAALERARGGGQVVGVVAEAGTGKSRLCAEFVESCRARGIPILEGRGVAHGKAIPMLPMLEMWRAFYEIGDGDGPETTRARIAGRLLLMDESFREVLPFVFDLFGVPDPANPAPAIDPEQRQKRIHGVLKRILHDPAYGGLRVILLEDLHWFDGASDAYLETTVESVPATRDLLLVTSRPEYQARWMQRSYYQQLPLQPLDPEAIRALLRDQLGEDPSVAALPEIIHAHTKGNPFFIEEVVQSLVEGGQLAGGRGAYRLATPVEAMQVPASVQAVLSSRIDRVPEREKQVLQTAAVIGHFHAGEGRAALEWSARVLEEVGSDNVLGKEFVGYSPRVGALHVRAQALMFLGRLPEAWDQVRLAERVAEASRELEVFTWMQITRAMLEYTCGRPESGLEHGRRSLEIAEKLDNEASRIAAYAALGLANLVEGQPAAARDAFRECATIARDCRVVRALLPLVLAGLAEAHLALGEPSDAVATAREGIDLGSAGGCLYNEALAQLALAAALLATDCVVPRAEIEAALERAEHLVASIEGSALSPRILELRGRLAAAVGDAPASDRTFRKALDLYRAIGATGHAERLARELDA